MGAISEQRGTELEAAAQSFLTTSLMAFTKRFPEDDLELEQVIKRVTSAARLYRDAGERVQFVTLVAVGALAAAAKAGNHVAVQHGFTNYAAMLTAERIDIDRQGWGL